MSSIKALETLSGSISASCSLKGTISAEISLTGELSCVGGLAGTISIAKEYDAYAGNYEVTPQAFEPQILPTNNRVLKEDIIVREVPFYETSNTSDGTTAYIGKDIQNGI